MKLICQSTQNSPCSQQWLQIVLAIEPHTHGSLLPVVEHIASGGGSNVVVSHNPPAGHQKSGSGSGIEIIKFGRIWRGRRPVDPTIVIPAVTQARTIAILHVHATPHNVAFLASTFSFLTLFPMRELKKKRVSFPIGIYPQRSNKGSSYNSTNQQDRIQLTGNINRFCVLPLGG